MLQFHRSELWFSFCDTQLKTAIEKSAIEMRSKMLKQVDNIPFVSFPCVPLLVFSENAPKTLYVKVLDFEGRCLKFVTIKRVLIELNDS